MSSKSILWICSFAVSILCFAIVTNHFVSIQGAYDPDETQLTDQDSVAQYLERTWYSSFNNQDLRPIEIPTGVFINTISWEDSYSFLVSGYLWQKYPLDYPRGLSKGFILPEAVDVKKNLTYRDITDTHEILGWYFQGRIRQSFDYSRYPLDNKNVQFRLWHEDFAQRVLLVPDLSSYDSTLSTDKFGLDPDIVMGEYEILETFFRYRHPDFDTSFGFNTSKRRKNFPELFFNIALKRYASNAIVAHVLPIIAVIFLCFSTLLSNTLNAKRRGIYNFGYMQVLTECAALFFVVLLAHIHIREVFSQIGIIYLEYMYITAYFAVLYVAFNGFLVVHSELSEHGVYRLITYKDNLLPKILFLPLVSAVLMSLGLLLF